MNILHMMNIYGVHICHKARVSPNQCKSLISVIVCEPITNESTGDSNDIFCMKAFQDCQ